MRLEREKYPDGSLGEKQSCCELVSVRNTELEVGFCIVSTFSKAKTT